MNTQLIKPLLAISLASLFFTGMEAQAQIETTEWKLNYQYSTYQEDGLPKRKRAPGSRSLHEVDTHQLSVDAPLSEDFSVNVTLLKEDILESSSTYVEPDGSDLLLVVNGKALRDTRTGITAAFINQFERSKLAITLGEVTERDYKSFSGSLSGTYKLKSWLNLDWGFNYSSDSIDAIDKEIYIDRPDKEPKSRMGTYMGVTYAFSKTTLLGFRSSYVLLDGFLSDPYKLALVENTLVHDNRPDSNQLVSNTLQVRQFIPSRNAAIHFDYQYFISDWLYENANTIELGWYQNFRNGWQLIPSIRYYDQPAAYFYRPYYRSARRDDYYSSDYRLSAFKAISTQIKVEKQFTSHVISFSYETYEASGSHPGLVSSSFLKFGIAKTF